MIAGVVLRGSPSTAATSSPRCVHCWLIAVPRDSTPDYAVTRNLGRQAARFCSLFGGLVFTGPLAADPAGGGTLTTMAATQPDTPAATHGGRTIHLMDLLKRPITDSNGESLGRVQDVIVRLGGHGLPVVTGLVAKVGGRQVFVPVGQTGRFDGSELKLTSAQLDLRRFERRDGEVLLRADVLGHRLIDVPTAHLVRAADLELREQPDGEWVLAGVDVHRRPRGLLRLLHPGADDEEHNFRDWSRFEPLIGHASSAGLRGPLARIRRLKPAQIADLLEDASKDEETEILGQVHADPELEADVFEELDEDAGQPAAGRAERRGDRRGAGPDAGRRRRGRDRRAAAAAAAARARPAARPTADQGADPDGVQPDQRGRPDGRRFPDPGQRRRGGRRAGRGGQRGERPARGADQRARGRGEWPAARRGHRGPAGAGRPGHPAAGYLRPGPGTGRGGHRRGRRGRADERLQPDHGPGGGRGPADDRPDHGG